MHQFLGLLPGTSNPQSLQALSIVPLSNSQRQLRGHSVTASASATGERSLRYSPNRELLRSLLQQARKETVPWLQDLLAPLLAGTPEPLTDTLSPQELADADSSFTEVDGVTLHYKDVGAQPYPAQPVVLLLHGFNGSVFSWRNSLQPIAQAGKQGCRVIAVDRPPFGLSQRPLSWNEADGNPYTATGNAKLALGLAQKLGISQVIPVGHSQGALVAMEMYKLSPDSVAGLIFVAPALPGTSNNSSWTRRVGLGRQLQFLYTRALLNSDGPGLQYVRRQIRQRAEEVRNGGKLGVFADEEIATEMLIEGYLKPMRAHDWDKGSLYSFRTMSFPNFVPYDSITPPVLVITGEKDIMLTKSAKQIVEVLRKRTNVATEYVEFENCGHVPMDERSDDFVAAVVPFVTSILQQGAPAHPSAGLASLEDLPNQPLQAATMTQPEYDAIPIAGS